MKKYLLALMLAWPLFALSQNQSVTLFGMSSEGGSQLLGNIFQTNSSGTSYQTDYSFYIQSTYTVTNVIQAYNGVLYGVQNQSGINNGGAIYSFNISTSTEADVHRFGYGNDGADPQSPLIEAKDSLLYGTTNGGGANLGGTIYSYNILTNSENVLHNFSGTNDGYYPTGALYQSNTGLLYGLTTRGGMYDGGIIYSYNIATGVETELYDFGNVSDGKTPEAAVIQATNGLLYGVTKYGGTNSKGVIFSFDITTGIETVVYNFGTGSTDGIYPEGTLVQPTNGLLYGNTSYGGVMGVGTFFSYNISTGIETDLHEFGTGNDGDYPFGSPTLGNNGLIYDMTADGGTNGINGGTIFTYDTLTHTLVTIYNFTDGMGGSSPQGALIIASSGLLYGVTYAGGAYGRGVIFNFNSTNYQQNGIYSFGAPSDGQYPEYSLSKANNGLLYGVTNGGGVTDSGTLFSFNPSTYKETELHNFNGTDGALPIGTPVQAGNGLLYAMTDRGGMNGDGTIFSYSISTGTLTKVHDFAGDDGKNPFGSLLAASNGLLYGMTNTGGTNNKGVIFSFDTLSNAITGLHNFDGGSDGANPFGALIQANDTLYGMTYSGGINNLGTIFSYNISTTALYILHSFGSGTDGQNPYGSLLKANNGLLYGMTYGGGMNSNGTMFSYDVTTGTETDIYDFGNGQNGSNPFSSLIQAKDGLLYGMTAFGSIYGEGTIFNYDIATNTETDMFHFLVGETGGFPYGDLLEDDHVTQGIEQLTMNSGQLIVYPNPTTGQFTINTTGNQNGKTVEVYNIMGEKIYEAVVSDSQNTINLNSQPQGLYFVYLKTDNGIEVGKVVIRKVDCLIPNPSPSKNGEGRTVSLL